ncbi:glutamyl-tRNA(Gln) amidotransferase subunit B, mitochondrial [Aplysia californica]|uniref:Glutamyl-tRNA(Gln) amidotransferase subunit B, mitochondrial n=1 Tax=Aplysia californica TaxID=6500 RepID=A0ABM1VU84_APLCA|nr:glutamyl-tRNA(Gln) amidotransferase subunit B, mitochondrial [Aplysia californica]
MRAVVLLSLFIHARSEWQSVIGLEIHAQIQSRSKLFSRAGTSYGASTNSQVSHFDAALPGTLPVLNRRCVEAGVLTALALGCDINMVSKFDRKHYFYADLPAGYQITQQRQPLAVNGQVTYVYQCSRTSRVERRSARLIQLQLEQDSGKSLHDSEQRLSLIDLNRAGVGLMEIVTAPDFCGGDDAASFVRDLRDVLVSIGTCDGKMAEGSLRVDANISVNRPGEEFGVRTEVKNLNSVKSMRAAINYEIERQIQILDTGGTVVNETRSFDLDTGETVAMRDKEKVLDYRFMPEPNLPPLVLYSQRESVPLSLPSSQRPNVVVLEEVQGQMKELPEDRRKRLETRYGVSLINSVILVRAELDELFETLVTSHGCDPGSASHVVRNNYNAFLDERKLTWRDSPIETSVLAEIVRLYHEGKVSGSAVSVLLSEKTLDGQLSVSEVIERHNLWMLRDTSVIEAAVTDVFSRNPKMIKAYKKGKVNQLDVLAAKVMKKLEGKADSRLVLTMVSERLKD